MSFSSLPFGVLVTQQCITSTPGFPVSVHGPTVCPRPISRMTGCHSQTDPWSTLLLSMTAAAIVAQVSPTSNRGLPTGVLPRCPIQPTPHQLPTLQDNPVTRGTSRISARPSFSSASFPPLLP